MTPRLVMITRRYWPLVGGPEHALAQLARGVHELGVAVTLLTPRWQPDWPEQLDDQGVRVLRLPESPQGWWSRRRWLRRLRDWLIDERENYDLVFTLGLAEESLAAWKAKRVTRRPFVIRASDWRDVSKGFRKHRVKHVLEQTALVSADGPALCAALTAAGCPRSKIHDIPDGVAAAPSRSADLKFAARLELAEADPSLVLEEGAPLALYAGPLALERGLPRLIEAWRAVTETLPEAKLWILGTGPLHHRLSTQIQTAHLAGRVLLVSPFDTMESFYQAADLFVQPGAPQSVSFALREAMAAGLPCVVADSRTSRRVMEPGWHGLLAPGEDAAPLAEAILRLLQDPSLADQFGAAARSYAAENFALAKVAAQHVELWNRLLASQKKA